MNYYKDFTPAAFKKAVQKSGLLEDFVQWFAATRQIVLLGLFHQFVQPPGFGVGVNLLVPKLLAKFLKPVGDFMDFLRLQFLNGRFDFLHCAHGVTLIQPMPLCTGRFYAQSGQDMMKPAAEHGGEFRVQW
ncbi:MAG: hypothetical protein WBW41_12835 [Verrucomicrobiia bacterium]